MSRFEYLECPMCGRKYKRKTQLLEFLEHTEKKCKKTLFFSLT